MKLKQRYIFLAFSLFFAALLGDRLRTVFNEHDVSQIPLVIIYLGFMVSCFVASYLLEPKDEGEATT